MIVRLMAKLKPMRLLAAALALTACAATMPEVPPFDAEGQRHPGKVVWHDLVTPDLASAKAFYGGLFGWTFEEVSDDYVLVRLDGRLIAGMARLDRSGRASHWLPLVSVSDLAMALDRVDQAGGAPLIRPFDLANRGRIAVLKDSRGAAFGIVQSSHGDPADRDPDLNGWLWDEIWTDDIPATITFYESVGGYQSAVGTIGEIEYRYLASGGRPRVGLLEKPSPDIGNTWVAYVRVADVDVAVYQAERLGGQVLMSPDPSVRKGTVAVLTDPGGAGFIVQEWNR